MPAVQPPSKVLVSGANGYIAVWVVRSLLEKGYSVRGTVRSAEKGKHLQELFKSYGDKHEVVEGAFDDAVKGVDAIEHTASPFHFKCEDPEDLIRPAVDGTVGILKSALIYGSSVKRVVITSSCAAIVQDSTTSPPTPQFFSELNWNEQAEHFVKTQGKAAAPSHKYRASKTLAEKAAWRFVKENSVGWDLVVINPPFVFGPPIHSVLKVEDLNTSAADWYTTALTQGPVTNTPAKLTMGGCWIDVRDLGAAHVAALATPQAGGERLIITAGPFVWQDWVNVVNELPKDVLAKLADPSGIPTGDPARDSSHPETTTLVTYKTEKAARILGMGPSEQGQGEGFTAYRTMKESAEDMVQDFASRGW
ncbi:D-lactaldehyde dehydrogenase [Athelia psychrophila]|uniref:D-lactaldehyde dehydrogenase n=1 Tax=Athelia psychrophila TaxID=1759441 RepID=A0A166IFM1_9AGAM|nr:D-lactaldehyde dehydrogenase [Fibularhizoctonia sp. CBS 109695]